MTTVLTITVSMTILLKEVRPLGAVREDLPEALPGPARDRKLALLLLS